MRFFLKSIMFTILLSIITSCAFNPLSTYYYAVGLGNIGPTSIDVYYVEIYPDEEIGVPMFGINCTHSPYTKKPNRFVDLYWLESDAPKSDAEDRCALFPNQFEAIYWGGKDAGQYKKHYARVDMTLPPQFTPKTGAEIEFSFFKGNVIVIYHYKCAKYIDAQGYVASTRLVLSDGTPVLPFDFMNYMNAHPNASTQDFIKHQRVKYPKKSKTK